MAKSTLLREREVRAVLQLVGECRELGEDYVRWRTHLGEQLSGILNTRVAMSGQVPMPGAHGPIYSAPPEIEHGWDNPVDHDRCHAYWDSPAMMKDPFAVRFLFEQGTLRTGTRSQFVEDSEWFRLPFVHEVFRECDIGSILLSWRPGSTPGISDRIVLLRRWTDREFDAHDWAIVNLLHDELAPLLGTALADGSEPSPHQLTPRQRQILELLLAGHSDRQICSELNLTRATVSEYCGAIYRHFGCNGRAELLAHFLRRHRAAPAIPGPFELDAKG